MPPARTLTQGIDDGMTALAYAEWPPPDPAIIAALKAAGADKQKADAALKAVFKSLERVGIKPPSK